MIIEEINGLIYVDGYNVAKLIEENKELKKQNEFLMERENKLQQVETILHSQEELEKVNEF